MEHLAIKTQLGKLFCQSRTEREAGMNYCMKNNITITTVVEKVFSNRNDAQDYCDRINEVNNLIKNI